MRLFCFGAPLGPFFRRVLGGLSRQELVEFQFAALRQINGTVGMFSSATRYRAPRVAMACIRPVVAAKECRMSKKPTGIANGLTNYGDGDFSLYLRRSFAQSMGYSRAMLEKPVVGIAYTGSGFNNCHRHFPELLDAVKRGVLPPAPQHIQFPPSPLGVVSLHPNSLKLRNEMSMDTEETVRAQLL